VGVNITLGLPIVRTVYSQISVENRSSMIAGQDYWPKSRSIVAAIQMAAAPPVAKSPVHSPLKNSRLRLPRLREVIKETRLCPRDKRWVARLFSVRSMQLAGTGSPRFPGDNGRAGRFSKLRVPGRAG